jgi:hypothetical protein
MRLVNKREWDQDVRALIFLGDPFVVLVRNDPDELDLLRRLTNSGNNLPAIVQPNEVGRWLAQVNDSDGELLKAAFQQNLIRSSLNRSGFNT